MFFFSSRRRHTRWNCDWSSDVCSSDLPSSSPGPANSMGKMKFMFPNAQGIWLHDTPEKEKIEDAARLQSNGCVRSEERRVGKECRSRWWPDHEKKKKEREKRDRGKKDR